MTCGNCKAYNKENRNTCLVCGEPLGDVVDPSDDDILAQTSHELGQRRLPAAKAQLNELMRFLFALAIIGIIAGIYNLVSLSFSLAELQFSIDWGKANDLYNEAQAFEGMKQLLAVWGYSLGSAAISCNIWIIIAFVKRSRTVVFAYIAFTVISVLDVISVKIIMANRGLVFYSLFSTSPLVIIIGTILRVCAIVYLFLPEAREILKK